MSLPILYSLRNCPFAIRARLAIFKSQQSIFLRDVVLKNKPAAMLLASPKGTVPILVLNNSRQLVNEQGNDGSREVIDESLDIMLWALNNSDPDDLLHSTEGLNNAENLTNLTNSEIKEELNVSDTPNEYLSEILALINQFDTEFKEHLEAYKCAKRYHETSLIDYRITCQHYIELLESRLSSHAFLISNKESLADIALLPFIRQFARVERQWYLQSPYPNVRKWLNNYLQSSMFTQVMVKNVTWIENDEAVIFPVFKSK